MNARIRLAVVGAFCHLAGLLLVMAAIIVSATPAHADMARIRRSGALKVALYKGLPPFSDNAGGQFSGIDVALANALGKQMGLSASLLSFDADDGGMSGDLRNMVWKGHCLGYGPADVMLHVPVDPNFIRQNDQVLIFTPYFREGYVLVYDSDRVRKVSNFKDLAGQAIGAEQGSGGASALLSSANGALHDKVKIYPETNEALRALFPDQIAAAMVTRAQYENAPEMQNQSAARFVATGLQSPLLPARGWATGVAVKADQRELAQALETVFNTLRASGELQRIFAQYGVSMVAPQAPPLAHGAERADVPDAGALRATGRAGQLTRHAFSAAAYLEDSALTLSSNCEPAGIFEKWWILGTYEPSAYASCGSMNDIVVRYRNMCESRDCDSCHSSAVNLRPTHNAWALSCLLLH